MKYKILAIIAATFLMISGLATAAPTISWEQVGGNAATSNCGFTDDINVCRENIRQQLLRTPYVSEIRNLQITFFNPSVNNVGREAQATWTADRRGTVFCTPGQTMEQCRGAYMQGPYSPQGGFGSWVGGAVSDWPTNAVFLPDTFTGRQPWTNPFPLTTVPSGTAPWNKVVNSPNAPTTWTPELWACSMYGQCR